MTKDRSTRLAAPLWATGQVAVQIFRDVPSLLLLFYMTQVFPVSTYGPDLRL